MKTNGVKRDRVGVLASTIVRELASARIESIRRQDVDTTEPAIAVTPKLKAWLKQYADAKKAERQAEKAVEALGYRIYRDDPPSLAWPHKRWDVEKQERRTAKERRMNTVRELRTNVLIDLVSLDEQQVKDTVKKFRTAIEQI